MPYGWYILIVVILIAFLFKRRSNSKQQYQDDLPTHSKGEIDFFKGKPHDNEFKNWYDEIKENEN